MANIDQYSCWDAQMLNNTVNETVFDRCGERGKCLPYTKKEGAYLCKCSLYYDPTTFCDKNIFEIDEHYIGFYAYMVISLTVFIVSFVFYICEFATDLKFNGIGFIKKTVSIVKMSAILYHVLKMTYLIMFSWGLLNQSTNAVAAQLVIHMLVINLLAMTFLLASINWMEMMLRTKNLGYTGSLFTIVRKIYIGIVCIGCPALTISSIFSKLSFYTTIFSNIVVYGGFVIIIPSCIINLVCASLTLNWLSNNDTIQEKRRKRVIFKTACLMIASIVLFVSFAILPFTSTRPGQFSDVILSELFSSLIYEYLVSLSLWLFSQNHGLLFSSNYSKIWLLGKKGKGRSSDNSNPQSTSNSSDHQTSTTLSVPSISPAINSTNSVNT